MKILSIISILVTTTSLSCNVGSQDDMHNRSVRANVEKVDAIYVFIKSKPLEPYDLLGAVEFNWYDKLLKLHPLNLQMAIQDIKNIVNFNDNISNIVSLSKQKYPDAEGVIFNDNLTQCNVIKFKK